MESKMTHPSDDPNYKKSLKVAERRQSSLRFENDAEERDYRKRVDANPNNIYGLPAFFPPLKLPSIAGIGEGKVCEKLPCGHRWTRIISNGGTLRYTCKHRCGEYTKKEFVE